LNINALKNNFGPPERFFNLLVRVLVYSSVFYFFSFVTADIDLWGHIKFGADLWSSKWLHGFDIYSYTAYGREWINHEWLSELLMYAVYKVFGSGGLLIGKLLIGFAIIYFLSSITSHRSRNPVVYCLVFVLSIYVMSPGFMIRPQLLTFLFVSYFLYVFHMYIERGKNLLWSLPLIMVLWVNCHGGFLIGLGIFPVVVVCEVISCRFNHKNTGYLRSLIIWLVLTEFSILVNPYGYKLLAFLYGSLSVPRNVSEWHPVGILDLSYLRFKVLAILVLASFFWNNRGKRLWEVGMVLVALIYAFRYQRHTPVFAILAAPYLTENLSVILKRLRFERRLGSFPSYVALDIFLCLLIGYQLFSTTNKYIKARFNIIVDPTEYPVYAVHFIKGNGIKGNILLPFEWGEYAIWKLYPDCRVSVDGRFRTVYPESVLEDHLGAFNESAKFSRLLDKYPADILLGRQNPTSEQLISTPGNWIYVYSDRVSIIFIRDTKSQKETLEKFRRKQFVYPDEKLSVYFP
jgi:hypothetical protein